MFEYLECYLMEVFIPFLQKQVNFGHLIQWNKEPSEWIAQILDIYREVPKINT